MQNSYAASQWPSLGSAAYCNWSSKNRMSNFRSEALNVLTLHQTEASASISTCFNAEPKVSNYR